MIPSLLVRVAAPVVAGYLVFVNPTFLGEGTPLFAVAIALLFVLDVFGIELSGTDLGGPHG